MGRAYQPAAWAEAEGVSLGLRALSQVLSSYADRESGDQDVWPAPETVAKRLGITARYVQDFSKEGEDKGWWTRIYQRTHTGGRLLTWRLHFPVITPSGTRTEPERNDSSVGCNDSGSQAEPERNPSGTQAEPERNQGSAVMVEGGKVGREEEQPAASAPEQFGLTLPERKEPSAAQQVAIERREKAGRVAQLWNELMVHQVRPARVDDRNKAVLAKALDTVGSEQQLRDLLVWSQTSDWHSGRKGSREAIVWFASGSLGKAMQDMKNASYSAIPQPTADLILTDEQIDAAAAERDRISQAYWDSRKAAS